MFLMGLFCASLIAITPGVSEQYGMIYIGATRPSGNAAAVSIDPDHGNDLRVTLNGDPSWYDAGSTWTIGYEGAPGGSDSFVNDTNIADSFYGYGGGNVFRGGGGYNNVFVYGDGNDVDTRGGPGSVTSYGGPHDAIAAYGNVVITRVGIPGVWEQYGMVTILATRASGSMATVSIDPDHGNDLRVTLDGGSVWYDAGSIWTIGYDGSQGGSDTFVNDTDVPDSFYGYGGGNHFYGGGGYNNVVVYGDDNTVDTRGGPGHVSAYNGPHDDIVPYGNVTVETATYDTSWFWW
jgi:hypothetical protein